MAKVTGPIGAIFGETFGTVYDITTVVILWFAGASAMSGLLSLVPRYLPRYGMAPRWAEAFRPLVVLFTAIGLLVTWIFEASVEAQGGAYATGVMVLITSACVATVIDQWHKRAHAHGGGGPRRRDHAPHPGLARPCAVAIHVYRRRVPVHDRGDRRGETGWHQDRRCLHRVGDRWSR